MTPQQTAAARMLLNTTALAGHPHIARCIEPDGWLVEWPTLEQWNWSSGERVLLELLRTFILGHGQVQVADLYKLDTDNRMAAAAAIALGFGAQTGSEVWE